MAQKSEFATVEKNMKVTTQNVMDNYQQLIQSTNNKEWINPVHGNIYQLKVLMLFLFRGISRKYSFRLGTEVKEAGKFDDLVFEYVQDDEKIYRLLQAKHKINESKKITVDNLLLELNGDYSLIKYFQSYQACKRDEFFKNSLIKDVTICTNIDFDFKNLKAANIEVKEITEKDDLLDVKRDKKQPRRFMFTDNLIPKLKIKLYECKIDARDEEIKDFLQHVIFAVNQPNEEELGKIIKSEIGEENAYNKFFIRMLDWMKGKRAFMTHIEGQEFIEDARNNVFVWFNVQNPVKSFTGRTEQLTAVHEILQTDRNTMACISGLGGVGKSELAKKYIADYGHHYDDNIIWLNAENYQSLSDSICTLACEKLGIETKNANGEKKEISTLMSEIYRYFSKSKSLFIFDNAEIYKSNSKFDSGIEPFMPTLPNNCNKPNILVTSRNQKWPENMKVLVLEAFSENEATTFVFESLQLIPEEKKYATELGKKLELLPLALQQAVAYIRTQDEKLSNIGLNFRINDYFVKFSESSQECLNFELSNDCDNRYTKTVLTTWNVTLDAISVKENGCDALDILNIMSYLLPDNIPIDLFLIFIKDKDKLATALELLKQYSLITVQHKVCSIHRLVQQVIRMKLIRERKEENTLEKILEATEIDYMNDNTVDHFISIWSHSKKYRKLIECHCHCPINILNKLMKFQRIFEAGSLANELAELFEQLPSNEHIHRGMMKIIDYIANIYLLQGKYVEALNTFDQLHEMKVLECGSTDLETLGTRYNIAKTLSALGRKDAALENYKKLLKIYRIHLGENNLQVALTKSGIASILMEKEMYDEASKLFEEVYSVQKSILGDKNDETLNTKNSLGFVFHKQEKYKEALKIFEEVINVAKEDMNEKEPIFLNVRNAMALTLMNLGKCDEALSILHNIFEIKKKIVGDNHPDLLIIQANIADALRLLNKHDEALKILREILKKQCEIFGCSHFNALGTQYSMASILFIQRKFSEVIPIHQELLRAPELPEPSMRTKIHKQMSIIFREQGQDDKCLKHLEEVVKWYKSNLGDDHPDTLQYRFMEANVNYSLKYYYKALNIARQVQKTAEIVVGRNHVIYTNTLPFINNVLQAINIHEYLMQNSKPLPVENPFAAIAMNDFTQLKKIVKKNSAINKQDNHKQTLLHYTAKLNRLEMMKFLLNNQCVMTLVNSDGCTALHVGVEQGHYEIVEELLANISHDKWKAFIDAKTTPSGDTALHLAAKNGFINITKLLMCRGATYNVQNSEGKRPIDLAKDSITIALLNKTERLFELACSGNKECFEDLRECSIREYLAFRNTRDFHGHNLMQIAFLNNHRELVDCLQFEEVMRFRQDSLLPTFNGDLMELMQLFTNIASRIRDENCNTKKTLKHVRKLVAVSREKDKRILNFYLLMIEEMLELKKSCEGDKPSIDLAVEVIKIYVLLFEKSIYTIKLYEASKRNDLTTIETCVSKFANANVTDREGWTPLLYAVNAGSEKIVKLLLEYDSSTILCKTLANKNTPLHIAVNKGHLNIVKILLETNEMKKFLNAKTEAKESTAMHTAAKIGRFDIVLLLLTKGAIYCFRNKDGQLPVDLASDDAVKKFLKFIDELFVDAKNGRTQMIGKLKALKLEEFLAVTSTFNEEEYRLHDAAAVEQHKELAREIIALISQAQDVETLKT